MTQNKLKCGAGRAVITPPLGTILYGYAPGRPAKAVGDDLTATAILLSSGGERALLVTCTLASMNPELCARLRDEAGRAAGVPARNVIVCATHTHSGPNTSLRSGWGEVDYDYIESILAPGVVRAAGDAAATLRPALMGVAETESDVGINRRELLEDGSVVLGQNPWGPHDPRLTVVSFRGEDGSSIANFVHYCCHCTASGANPEITRDWAGVMIDMLEEQSGGLTCFLAGVEGDQGPNLPNGKTTGNYAMALRLGARAGADAVRAYRSIKEWSDAPLHILHGDIELPFLPLAPREKAESELERLGSCERLRDEKRFPEINDYIHWKNVLEEYVSGAPPKTAWRFEQDVVAIGPVAILPCPFEAFVEIGLRLRHGSPYQYTLSLCNAHGCYAYLPTRGELERGGYEVWHFLLAMRTTYPLPRNSDDLWVQQNLALLRSLTTR